MVIIFSLLLLVLPFQETREPYDLIIKNGVVYDGTGSNGINADVGVIGDRIVEIGDLSGNTAVKVLDAEGLAVAPGFINMLSWAASPLMNDGRSMSDIKQGVTLEVFGEGSSLGPAGGPDREWTTLGEGLDYLVEQGVSTNVASFVGATTIRIYVLGSNDMAPDTEQLRRMQELVREAMREGALGVGTSLIYPPAFYADTDELIALAEAAAEYDGMYISHMRSEGDKLLEAVDELVTISGEAGIDAEIYHLKAAGERNWHKLDMVLDRIDSLQNAGHHVTANMYTYPAASTGLAATVPPWVREGSFSEFIERIHDPEIRERVLTEMNSPETEWENFLQLANDPDNILLLSFNAEELQPYIGKTLGEVAEERGTDPANTALDLLTINEGNIQSVFFLMAEENIRRQIQLPYMTFGSDARSVAAEGWVLQSSTHPRTYGTFARLLGKYVRDEKLISLEEAIHRLTGMPAERLKIENRGRLQPGYFADVVIFDPETIEDRATYVEPHQYSVGVKHVFVNGVQVLDSGEHTGETPGRFVKGPGYEKR
ncbi:MAG: D-aminoacylase [Balneolaceae bacterium]